MQSADREIVNCKKYKFNNMNDIIIFLEIFHHGICKLRNENTAKLIKLQLIIHICVACTYKRTHSQKHAKLIENSDD